MKGRKKKVQKDKKQDKRIRNLELTVSPEVKDTGFGQILTATTGTFTLQYAPLIPSQGVLSSERIGLDLNVHGIDFRYYFANGNVNTFNYGQCWIIRDMGQAGAQLTDAQMRYSTATAIQNALSGWNTNRVTPPMNFKNKLVRDQEKNRIQILYESPLFNLAPFSYVATQTYQGPTTQIMRHKRLRFTTPKKIKLLGVGSTIASAGMGTIQVVWAGSTSDVFFGFGAVEYFTDC